MTKGGVYSPAARRVQKGSRSDGKVCEASPSFKAGVFMVQVVERNE